MHVPTRSLAITLTLAVAGLAAPAAVPEAASAGPPGTVERVSVSADDVQGDDTSNAPAISANGRYVAFTSTAANLVAGDTNGVHDVFVRDRTGRRTERISVSTSGGQGSAWSGLPSISFDGRYVVFSSVADNLVAGVSGWVERGYLRDRLTGTTTLITVNSRGEPANDTSEAPVISVNGRFAAFTSRATNLVSGDTNGNRDVFVRDLVAGTTERVSVESDGSERLLGNDRPAISADGRFVTFVGREFGGPPHRFDPGGDPTIGVVFLRDRKAGTTEEISVDSQERRPAAESSAGPAPVSADGRLVAFSSLARDLVPGDTNRVDDVFVRDRRAGTTQRVSLDVDGTQSGQQSFEPAMSIYGLHIAYTRLAGPDSSGSASFEVFAWDGQTRRTQQLTGGAAQGPTQSNFPDISADGRSVSFHSFHPGFVPGDTNRRMDVFVYQR